MQRIKKWYLDDEIIEKLDNSLQSGKVDWSDLSYELRLRLMNAGSSSSGGSGTGGTGIGEQVLTDLNNDIKELKSTALTKQEGDRLLADYIKKRTPGTITRTMLEAGIQQDLSKLTLIMSDINKAISDYLSTNKVLYEQLDSETKNRIQGPSDKIENLIKDISAVLAIKEDIETVLKFTEVIKAIQGANTTMNGTVSECKTIVNQCNSTVTNLERELKQLQTTVNNIGFDPNNSGLKSGSIKYDDLSVELKERINYAQTLNDSLTTLYEQIPSFSGSVDCIYSPDGSGGIAPVKMIRNVTICKNDTEIAAARKALKKEIINIGSSSSYCLLLVSKADSVLEKMIDKYTADNKLTFYDVNGKSYPVNKAAEREVQETLSLEAWKKYSGGDKSDATVAKLRYMKIDSLGNNYLYAGKMMHDPATSEIVSLVGGKWVNIRDRESKS